MVAFLVTQPTEEPVEREDAKAYLRIDSGAEDSVVEALIAAARTDVERRTGRALMRQQWRVVLDKLPANGLVKLSPVPIVSVDSVTVYDENGAPQIISPSDYTLDGVSVPGRLCFNTRVQPGRTLNGIEIDITCGYPTSDHVPDALKQAIRLLVGFWFEHRDAADVGAVPPERSGSIDALLGPFRTPRLA